jgi:N-acetylglucosamine-6-phosphate deacetylase
VDVSDDRRVSLRGTPYLAGSALTMAEAVGNAARFTGLSLEEVLPMASTIPAKYAGIGADGTVTAEWNADRFELHILDVATSARGGHTC